ncbi:50S ribosomal protein L18e [Candidatus Woesearchaeota archaeon]|nr:MAG: 50S ribosomal protein L18e [Candidatus Woesearchaeota archaeon]
MKRKHTNVYLKKLVEELREKARSENVKLWARVANDLEKSTRKRRVVNLTRIEKNVKSGEIILVPGKVLAGGELDKKVDIAAFNFSESAQKKIKKVNGKCLTIAELMKNNPKGSKVRIIG